MSEGPHAHRWHYNDAAYIKATDTWVVIRFCKDCSLIQEIELHKD
jgi:hypothetical protein